MEKKLAEESWKWVRHTLENKHQRHSRKKYTLLSERLAKVDVPRKRVRSRRDKIQ